MTLDMTKPSHPLQVKPKADRPTWIWTVHVDELAPLVVLHKVYQSVLELRPKLDDKLVVGVDGETRRDKADVQRSAEWH